MSATPCGAKNIQVNESKIPSLVIDVTELSPRGEQGLEENCVVGARLESGKRDTSSKRRAKDQEGCDSEQPDLVKKCSYP